MSILFTIMVNPEICYRNLSKKRCTTHFRNRDKYKWHLIKIQLISFPIEWSRNVKGISWKKWKWEVPIRSPYKAMLNSSVNISSINIMRMRNLCVFKYTKGKVVSYVVINKKSTVWFCEHVEKKISHVPI